MNYNIPPHRRGDTWDGINYINITINGVPVNLTDAALKIEFRQAVDAPVALTLSTENGGIEVVNAEEGLIRLPPRLIEIPNAKYLYDLQVTFFNGVKKTYMSGSWEIYPDITE